MYKWLLIVILLGSSTAKAQYDSILSIPLIPIDEDSIAIHQINLLQDSLRILPAYAEYCRWDTFDIHKRDYDLTNWPEEKELALTTDVNKYHHPHYGHISSDFGLRRSGFHYGVDLKLQKGEYVYSAFDGVVRVAHYSKSYGNVVVVRHYNGLETLYAHMSKLAVKPNEEVKAGDKLGEGGNTGRSYGSHLHFECLYLDEPVNPHDLIDFTTCGLKQDTITLTQEYFTYLKEQRAVKWHRVRSGDTLSHIATRNGTTITKLCSLNNIGRNSILQIGQRLRVN